MVWIVLTTACVMFVLGKLHERWEWSRLIHEGILPKPKGKS